MIKPGELYISVLGDIALIVSVYYPAEVTILYSSSKANSSVLTTNAYNISDEIWMKDGWEKIGSFDEQACIKNISQTR